MNGETDLKVLLKEMEPYLNEGTYVFVSIPYSKNIALDEVIGSFNEKEGRTIILEKSKAEEMDLPFDFEAAWITLKIHSALDAVGLTAAFATALGENNISCNVIAGFYHDHIFVNKKDAQKAIKVLKTLSKFSS